MPPSGMDGRARAPCQYGADPRTAQGVADQESDRRERTRSADLHSGLPLRRGRRLSLPICDESSSSASANRRIN